MTTSERACGVELEVADLDEPAVAPDLEPARGPFEVEVGDADEDGPGDRRRRGPDRERDDRLVLPLAADRQDRDLGRDRGRAGDGRGERAVGGDEDLGVAGARRELARELERVAEVAAAARHLDAVEGLADAPEVGRLVDDDPCPPVRGDEADLAAGREVAERREGGRLGRLEPVRPDVRGAHAGRRVQHDHDVPCQPGRPLEERSRGEHREDGHEQQLEQQQQAASQLLPRRVGLDVGHEPRPQQRRGHDRLVAPQLEQVHRDDRRDEQQAEQRERGRERHQFSPAEAAQAAAARGGGEHRKRAHLRGA